MTDTSVDALAELRGRVLQFRTMSLPGQPMGMHMGTSYLVGDLERAVGALESERDALRAQLATARADALRDAHQRVWDALGGTQEAERVCDILALIDKEPS